MFHSKKLSFFFCLILLIVLQGCGGGSSTATPTTTAAAPINTVNTVLISEVAPAAYYIDDIAWFEIANPGSNSITLSGYSFNSPSLQGNNAIAEVTNFKLPTITIPARGFMVVATKVPGFDNLISNAQIIYIANGSVLPFWQANGSVELLDASGNTVDFVVFGNSSNTPANSTSWNGSSANPLPTGINQHGKSLVRLASGGMRNSHSAADWQLVNFSTPAGPNDVEPNVIDSDQDGIPDSAKISGATYNGIDLYAMGARSGQRDIFIQADHMNGTDPAQTPRLEALQNVVKAFLQNDPSSKKIHVHIDAGTLFSPSFNPALFNLGAGNAVNAEICTSIAFNADGVTAGCTSNLQSIKSGQLDVRRKTFFHYALFANSQKADGSCGNSGIAHVGGSDILITLGGCNFSTEDDVSTNLLINYQALILMHELGHNLGLLHGGDENNNYKPNYFSIMNYLYSNGLPKDPSDSLAIERYYLQYQLHNWQSAEKTICDLDYSPCSDHFLLNYSSGLGSTLNENNLLEINNIGYGGTTTAYADWDNNQVLTSRPVSINIHAADSSYPVGSVLHDYNDWAHLRLPFARYSPGSNAGNIIDLGTPLDHAAANTFNPMSAHPHTAIIEAPMRQHAQLILLSSSRFKM